MSSEDMDSLTFGATRLVRNLMTPASAKISINEYDYAKVGSWSPFRLLPQHAKHCCIPARKGVPIQTCWLRDTRTMACCGHEQQQQLIATFTTADSETARMQVLEGLNLTRSQFIDVCILCGCDYCGQIRGALSCLTTAGSLALPVCPSPLQPDSIPVTMPGFFT